MKQLYLLSFYKRTIRKIEISRETEKTYFFKGKDFYGRGDENSEQSLNKAGSNYGKWFDTFEDAKNHLVENCYKGREVLQRNLDRVNKELAEILAMTEGEDE